VDTIGVKDRILIENLKIPKIGSKNVFSITFYLKDDVGVDFAAR